MSLLMEELKTEKENLIRQINALERILPTYPKGSLNIDSNNGKPRYFHYLQTEESAHATARYIKKDSRDLITKLAQKDYDKKYYSFLKKRLKDVDKVITTYQNTNLTDLYVHMNSKRKQLVNPRCQTKAEYIAAWKSVQYEKKGFKVDDPELYTKNNERVRSKSEIIIANILSDYGIPYRYEYPFCVHTGEIIHPDFMVLNIKTLEEYYLEHFGMMDNPDYVLNQMYRIELYEYSGIYPGKNLIITHESKKYPLDVRLLKKIIQQYLL